MLLSISARLMACWSLLLAVAGMVAAFPGWAADAPTVRHLTITVAVDAAHERQPDWLEKFRRSVALVSAAYEKNFLITWEVSEVVKWNPSAKQANNSQAFLDAFPDDVPRRNDDVIIGLYGERCVDNFAGRASPFHGRLVLMMACANKLPAWSSEPSVISHELAHLFGAFHVRSHIQSVMNGDGRDVFDTETREVLALTRTLDFRKAELAILDIDAGSRKKVATLFDNSRVRDSMNPVAAGLQLSAEVFARRGEWDTAAQLSREALEIDKRDWFAYRVLGGWHQSHGRLDEALQSFRQALEMAPGEPVSLAGMAAVLTAQGKSQEAIAAYSKAGGESGDWIVAKHNRAVLYIQEGKLQEAERDLRDVVKSAPDTMDAYINLAAALGLQRKLSDAVDVLQQALSRNPDNHMARANLGYTYALMGKLDEAIVEYRKALALQPNDPKTRINLNNALAQQARARRK